MSDLKARASACVTKLGMAQTHTDMTLANPAGVIIELMQRVTKLEETLSSIGTSGVLPDQVNDLRGYIYQIEKRARDAVAER